MSHSVYHSSVNLPPCMPRPATRRHAGGRRTRKQRRLHGRRPNYGRRRVVAALLAGVSAVVVGVVLFVAILAIGLLAGSGGRPASASRAEPANTAATTYVAVAGDSLWSIAEANHGEVDIDWYVEALIDINGGTSVQIGQAVGLP
jgi:hypothetical protein